MYFRSLLILALVSSIGLAHAIAKKPNIIFILADDLGWRDTGFTGTKYYQTPNIDRLASQGMAFSAAYSGGPNCAPTRACLMSGAYTPRHKIFTPGNSSKGNPKYMRLLVPAKSRKDKKLEKQADALVARTNNLDADFVCIPEVIGPAGYRTARFGKWHLGEDTQGFDESSGNGIGGPGGSFYGKHQVTTSLTERAVKFVEDNREGPFFLYLPYWDVHTPHRAREDRVAKHKARLESIPEAARDPRWNPVYAGMIEAVDEGVGAVLDKVDELGIAEDTLIIFSSDNGGLPHVALLDPLRGQKGSLFEAGVRVPTCMRWKGTIKAGSECNTPITSVDFLPTFVSLAGADLPANQPVDGTDFSPLLRGEPIEERAIFWHYPLYLQGVGQSFKVPGEKSPYSWRGFPSTSMRRGKWKLVEFHEDGSIALYDLEADPGESKNLAESMPELAAKLRAEMDAWQAETKAVIPSTPNPECTLPPLKGTVADLKQGKGQGKRRK